MRLQQQQHEPEPQNGHLAFAGASVGSDNASTGAQLAERGVQAQDTPVTCTDLLEQCSRDTPLLERLNSLTFFSTAFLVAAMPWLIGNKLGALTAVTAGTIFGMNYSMRRALTRGYRKDAELFAELGPDSSAELIANLSKCNARVEAVIGCVLGQLLPTMNREQFENIPPTLQSELYEWLRDGSAAATDSKIAVMQWLADVADETAVGFIEQIAKRRTLSPSRRKLRTAARAVLPQLLERIDNEQLAATSGGSLAAQYATSGAEEELDAETTAESRALVAEIRKHSANRSAPGMRMGYLIANWCFITPYVGYKLWESIAIHSGAMLDTAWLLLTIASSQLYRLALTLAHTRIARQLASSGDTQAIGALAEALEWPDEEIQAIARAALIKLLPKLTDSDAPLLNSRQRRCLNARLVLANSKNYLDSELQVRILQAWEKVGDPSSLPAVKSLVNAKAGLVNERKVQRAAIACLPLLEARAKLNESSQILLRASGIDSAGTDTLVRPASGKEVPNEELLRPTDD